MFRRISSVRGSQRETDMRKNVFHSLFQMTMTGGDFINKSFFPLQCLRNIYSYRVKSEIAVP